MSESFRVHLFHICILLPGCLLYKNAETTSANPVSSFTICDVTNRRVETMRGITTPVFTLLAFSALINDCWCRECYIFIHGTVSYRCRRTCSYILVLRYIKSWPTLQKQKRKKSASLFHYNIPEWAVTSSKTENLSYNETQRDNWHRRTTINLPCGSLRFETPCLLAQRDATARVHFSSQIDGHISIFTYFFPWACFSAISNGGLMEGIKFVQLKHSYKLCSVKRAFLCVQFYLHGSLIS